MGVPPVEDLVVSLLAEKDAEIKRLRNLPDASESQMISALMTTESEFMASEQRVSGLRTEIATLRQRLNEACLILRAKGATEETLEALGCGLEATK